MTIRKVKRVLSNKKEKYRKKLKYFIKSIIQSFKKYESPKTVIWIFGCQRSGTTFVESVFREDYESKVFGEFSELTERPDSTVLLDLKTLRTTIESQNAKYVVIRPLFESDRAKELLDLFPNSIGIWVFREAEAVIKSMNQKWNADFFEISRKVESNNDGIWRLDKPISKIVSNKDLSDEKQRLDAYLDFWLLRNSIPFEIGLDNHPRMLFLNYESLIHDHLRAFNIIRIKANLDPISNTGGIRIRRRKHNELSISSSIYKNNEVEECLNRLKSLDKKDFG